MQIDNLPEVTFDTLPELFDRLRCMNHRAGRQPGAWVDGKLARGAKAREYAPSHAEIMAAAFGDRIGALIAATGRDVLERQWPENRDRSIHYSRFVIRHADVMGSGRFFYSSAPIPVTVEILEVEP